MIQVWFSNRRARLRKQVSPTGGNGGSYQQHQPQQQQQLQQPLASVPVNSGVTSTTTGGNTLSSGMISSPTYPSVTSYPIHHQTQRETLTSSLPASAVFQHTDFAGHYGAAASSLSPASSTVTLPTEMTSISPSYPTESHHVSLTTKF